MSKAYVLVVDDEPDIRDLVREILEDEGYSVATADSAEAARERLQAHKPDLVLLDIWMPGEDGISLLKEWTSTGALGFPVVMISGHGTVETAVEATRQGATDFVEKPLSMGKLLVTVDQALQPAAAAPARATAMIEPVGRSPQMRSLRETAQRIGPSDSWVLISGESGSGRKCLARYLHGLSPRAGAALVERGAGALINGADTEALLADADGGTLILDEVGDLDSEGQARLAAAIEANKHDVRIMATTARDLGAEVAAGRFRSDLYYALGVVPMHVPPLREHVEDVPELVTFYVDRLVDRDGLSYRHFTVAAQNRLRHYSWPGNVRELCNLVQRLLVLGEQVEIDVDEVEQALATPTSTGGGAKNWPPTIGLDLPLREAPEQFARAYLQQQLQRANGSVARLARLAGMERTHLYRKLRSLGIDPKEAGETAATGERG